MLNSAHGNRRQSDRLIDWRNEGVIFILPSSAAHWKSTVTKLTKNGSL
jgi:hypothetical protein